MCGIAGLISLGEGVPVDERIIRRMCGAIIHRGPDDEGILVKNNAGLGMRRLSIIDLPGGRQPLGNETGEVWVVFNGEIYNFRELRKSLEQKGHRFSTNSDTECIIHLYEDYGAECVQYLNGMFAFCLWDDRTGTALLARDRLGKKPLYYTVFDNFFIFGSELKAILEYPGIKREIYPRAVDMYLTYDYIPAPYCIFKRFYKLEPGYRLTVKSGAGGALRRETYWRLGYGPKINGQNEPGLVEELHARLGEAVKKRLVADVPLGVFLSGGLDSSTVTALARDHFPGTLKTFSIGFEDPSFDESAYAREVAGYLETDHHERIFSVRDLVELIPGLPQVLDEPMADPSILPTYLLSKFTKERVTVALAGDGGDEMFAGYSTYQAHKLVSYYSRLPSTVKKGINRLVQLLPVSHRDLSLDFKAKQFLKGAELPAEIRNFAWKGGFSAAEKSELYTPHFQEETGWQDSFEPVKNLLAGYEVCDLLDKALYLDARLYLQDDILVKVDRASMACSLEVRAPILDYELVDWVTRLPAGLKMKGFTTKYLLKKLGKKILPKQIVHRKKKGFGIPVSRWLTQELKEPLQNLPGGRLVRDGLFSGPCIEKLVAEHLTKKKDNRKQLWPLLVLELWYRRYIG